MVKNIQEHPWSSYREYLAGPKVCQIDFALRLFSKDRKKALRLFEEFHLEENDDQCLEYNQNRRWRDSEAIDFIKKISDVRSPVEIQSFEKERRNDMIKKCKAEGLSIRQIERLTGISFGVIRRI